MQLNITAQDKLNARHAADAVCYALTQRMRCAVRALDMREETSAGFILECYQPDDSGKPTWQYIGRLEAKARRYFAPTLIRAESIDRMLKLCAHEGGWFFLALWFDEYPDVIHYRLLDKAPEEKRPFGHGARAGNNDMGYAFYRADFQVVPACARRLDSPNSHI